MGAFDDLTKSIIKSAKEKGRIKTHFMIFKLTDDAREPGMYSKVQNPIGIADYDRISLDALGRKGVLVKGKSVKCPHPEKRIDHYAFGNISFVPYNECRKCPSYISTKKNGKRFSECELKLRK